MFNKTKVDIGLFAPPPSEMFIRSYIMSKHVSISDDRLLELLIDEQRLDDENETKIRGLEKNSPFWKGRYNETNTSITNKNSALRRKKKP